MATSVNTLKAVESAIPQVPALMNQDQFGNLSFVQSTPMIVERIKNKIKSSISAASSSNSVINTPWFKPPTWTSSTPYVLGQVVVGLDGQNTYICYYAGTSAASTGPTGTGIGSITDGTAKWYWKGKVRGLANATSIITADTQTNLLANIPNAKMFWPSLTNTVGKFSGGVVAYNPSGTGDTVEVLGSNYQTAASPAYNTSPTGSLTFVTDSTKIIIASYNAVYTTTYFTIEINDRLIDDSFYRSSVFYNPGGYMIDLTNIPGAVGNFNKIKIITTHGFFSIARKIYIEPSASIYQPKNANAWSMAVEGDSLTAGGNGTPYHAGLDWVSQVGTMLGCDNVINFAQGGTGFISDRSGLGSTYIQRLSRLASLNADVYVIAGNHNDLNATPSDQKAAALTYLQNLRSLQPNSYIVVFGNNPLQGESSDPGSLIYIAEQNLKAAFDDFADPNSIFIPICTHTEGPWITGTGSTVSPANDGNKDKFYITADGHPIQRGVNYFALRYANALNTAFA